MYREENRSLKQQLRSTAAAQAKEAALHRATLDQQRLLLDAELARAPPRTAQPDTHSHSGRSGEAERGSGASESGLGRSGSRASPGTGGRDLATPGGRTVELRQELDLIRVQYAELRSAYNTLQLAAGEGAAARTRTR